MKFLSSINENFLLLGFTTNFELNQIGIVGIEEDGSHLENFSQITRFKDGEGSTSEVLRSLDKLDKIFNVVLDINVENEQHNLIVTKNNDEFSVYLANQKFQAEKLLGKTRASPLYFLDPLDGTPVLAWNDNDGYITFQKITKDRLEPTKYSKINGNFANDHFSSYLDLTGNLRPDLVLHVKNNGENKLLIYEFKDNDFQLAQELNLKSDDIQGLAFLFSSSNSLHYDLLVAKDDSSGTSILFYTNQSKLDISKLRDENKTISILKNLPCPEKIFPDEPSKTSHLDFKLRKKNSKGIQTGIYLADLNSSGENIIFFVSTDDKIHPYEMVENEFRLSPEFASLSTIENVLSVCAADLFDIGQLSVVINHVSNMKIKLSTCTFEKPAINNKIDISGAYKINKVASYAPGLTFLMELNNGARYKKLSQPAQSSFPSMYKQGVFVGIGTTNSFLQYLLVGWPVKKNDSIKTTQFNIFPNTNCIFYWNGTGLMSISCYFKTPHLVKIFVALGILAIIDLGILIYLTFEEKKIVEKTKGPSTLHQLLRVL